MIPALICACFSIATLASTESIRAAPASTSTTAATTQPAEPAIGVMLARYYVGADPITVTDAVRANTDGDTLTLPVAAFPRAADKTPRGIGLYLRIGGKQFYLSTGEDDPVGTLRVGSAPREPDGTFEITSARYGTPGHWQDVTDRFRGYIKNGRIGRNAVKMGDLIEGDPKSFEMEARFCDVPLHISFDERKPIESLVIRTVKSGASTQPATQPR